MDQQWTVALTLVEQKPKLASRSFVMQGFFEGLKDATVFPLHQACACPAVPVALVEALIAAFPAALYKPESSYARLPLHCACRTGANLAVVEALLRAGSVLNQEDMMCLQQDKLQRLPLHYALSNGAHPPTIRLLLDACPASTRAVDQRGWTPLHVAASVGCSIQVFAWILELHPHAASIRTLQGSLPQHVMHKTNPHYATLMQLLVDADKRGVTRSHSMPLEHVSKPVVSRSRSVDDREEPHGKNQRREWNELLVHSSVLV